MFKVWISLHFLKKKLKSLPNISKLLTLIKNMKYINQSTKNPVTKKKKKKKWGVPNGKVKNEVQIL